MFKILLTHDLDIKEKNHRFETDSFNKIKFRTEM